MLSDIFKTIKKEYSGLAIFSFLLVLFCWSVVFLDNFSVFNFPYGMSCIMAPQGSLTGAITGVIALVYMKKKGLKGKWFAIIAIIMGIIGSFFVCL